MIHNLFKPTDFLTAQVQLPPLGSLPSTSRKREVAFLTGASGFIGGYLLIELLRKEAFQTYYCLVRGETDAAALWKLEQNLCQKGLDLQDFADRIVCVRGDLAEPKMGLSPKQYHRLTEEVDHVYHFAGSMNWVSLFNAETEQNIEALRRVIRFASSQVTKTLHYASSMGTWSLLEADASPILETALHNQPELLPGGYCQLKWINEKICHLAQAAGVPVKIYRIGDVKGHSVTGHSDLKNFGNLLMCYLLQHGILPDCEVQFNFQPVEYVAQAIVHISLQKDQESGSTFQFSNPELISMSDLVASAKALGVPAQLVSLAEWKEALQKRTPLSRLLAPVFKPFQPGEGAETTSFFEIGAALYHREHDTTHTQEALKGSGITCPNMLSGGVLSRYLQFLAVRFNPLERVS